MEDWKHRYVFLLLEVICVLMVQSLNTVVEEHTLYNAIFSVIAAHTHCWQCIHCVPYTHTNTYTRTHTACTNRWQICLGMHSHIIIKPVKC